MRKLGLYLLVHFKANINNTLKYNENTYLEKILTKIKTDIATNRNYYSINYEITFGSLDNEGT